MKSSQSDDKDRSTRRSSYPADHSEASLDSEDSREIPYDHPEWGSTDVWQLGPCFPPGMRLNMSGTGGVRPIPRRKEKVEVLPGFEPEPEPEPEPMLDREAEIRRLALEVLRLCKRPVAPRQVLLSTVWGELDPPAELIEVHATLYVMAVEGMLVRTSAGAGKTLYSLPKGGKP